MIPMHGYKNAFKLTNSYSVQNDYLIFLINGYVINDLTETVISSKI